MGDGYINLPSLRAMLSYFEGNLSLITGRLDNGKYSGLFREVGFRDIFEIGVDQNFDDRSKDIEFNEWKGILQGFDLLIWLSPWIPLSKETFCHSIGDVVSVGYFDCFTYQVPYDLETNCFDLAFAFPRFFDHALKLETFSSPPRIPESISDFFSVFKSDHFKDFRILVVHNDSKLDKVWPDPYFDRLIGQILDKYDDIAVIDVGVRKINVEGNLYRDRILSSGLIMTFEYVIGLLSISDFYIGVDSSFLHLADLLKVPLIALFGPTRVEEWGVRFAVHKCVVAGDKKMESIDPGDVFKEFSILIDII